MSQPLDSLVSMLYLSLGNSCTSSLTHLFLSSMEAEALYCLKCMDTITVRAVHVITPPEEK